MESKSANKKVKDQSKSTQVKYKTDPEFKKKHLEYITTKMECECGKMISRCNMALHKRTKSHLNYLDGGIAKKKNKSIAVLLDLKNKYKSLGSDLELKNAIEAIDKIIEKLLDEI